MPYLLATIHPLQTDKQTDGQTDRQTDGQQLMTTARHQLIVKENEPFNPFIIIVI